MGFIHTNASVVPLSPTAECLGEEISTNPAQDQARANERDVLSTRLCLQYQLHRQATERAINAPAMLRDQYSISKLEAFAKYESSTSIPSAILVLLVTPVPCLVIMLLLQCFPLADPMLGWKANYVYFARMFAGMFATCMSMAVEINEFIPETQLSWRHLALIGFTQAIAFVGITIAIAEAVDVFPVPFSMLVSVGPMFAIGFLVHYALAHPRIPFIADFSLRYRRIMDISHIEALSILAYPLYVTIFMQLSSINQVWFSPLLPALKHTLRWALSRKLHTQMDVVSTMLASSHLFHILFTVMCLQNSKTLVTIGLILTWNIAQAVRGCIKLVQRSTKVAEQQRATTGEFSLSEGSRMCQNLTQRVFLLLEEEKVVSRIFRLDQSVLLSSYHRYHSAKWIAKHQELYQRRQIMRARIPQCVTHELQQSNNVPKQARKTSDMLRSLVAVGPSGILRRVGVVSHIFSVRQVVTDAIHAVEIQDSLVTLHDTELSLLHSSCVCFVSHATVIYVVVVFSSPNRNYIIATTRVSSSQQLHSVMNIVAILYAVEILIMIAYFIAIRATLSVLSIRQLAFVLSSQRWLIQPKFIAVTVIIFAFPVTHNGDDLTFEFSWLKHQNLTASMIGRADTY